MIAMAKGDINNGGGEEAGAAEELREVEACKAQGWTTGNINMLCAIHCSSREVKDFNCF